jgi:hypothetical protein
VGREHAQLSKAKQRARPRATLAFPVLCRPGRARPGPRPTGAYRPPARALEACLASHAHFKNARTLSLPGAL